MVTGPLKMSAETLPNVMLPAVVFVNENAPVNVLPPVETKAPPEDFVIFNAPANVEVLNVVPGKVNVKSAPQDEFGPNAKAPVPVFCEREIVPAPV